MYSHIEIPIPTCEVCGESAVLVDKPTFFTQHEADVNAFKQDWQVWKDEQGETHHRCYEHWSVTCDECFKTAEGNIHGKKLSKWEPCEVCPPNYLCPVMLCPDCAA